MPFLGRYHQTSLIPFIYKVGVSWIELIKTEIKNKWIKKLKEESLSHSNRLNWQQMSSNYKFYYFCILYSEFLWDELTVGMFSMICLSTYQTVTPQNPFFSKDKNCYKLVQMVSDKLLHTKLSKDVPRKLCVPDNIWFVYNVLLFLLSVLKLYERLICCRV